MRFGYTTGACAAAAAKAAVRLLVKNEKGETVTIDTPAGIVLTLPVIWQRLEKNAALAAIQKDGGDDPDATNGLLIVAKAEFTQENSIQILGGKGVGIVTREGLKIGKMEPAINPVPQQMIRKEVAEIQSSGIKITISVPEGERIAEKTFNPRLGILGGISILGTTGIVKPMSEEAWKDSIQLELVQKKANHLDPILFVFGRTGEEACHMLWPLTKQRTVIVSNFVGDMLDAAILIGLKRILLVGQLGKLSKIACGNFQTHSRVSDGRMELLACYAAMEGASTEVVKEIYQCVTTEQAEAILWQKGLESIFPKITEQAEQRCHFRVQGQLQVGCCLLLEKRKDLPVIGTTGQELLEKIQVARG